MFVGLSVAVTALAGGHDQELVLFYAVSVFLSFLAGLLAMARFSRHDRRPGLLLLNLTGAAAVAFTLMINLSRGAPLVSLAAALLIAVALQRMWVKAGKPVGIRNAAAQAESAD